ncbi:MAG: UDP-N-acetylmuramate dehydrogenase [Candidatus Omnitrophica bacterium]|nr:UDP-N-acetylmuramate dehydrogenase [Candidatus Omnitrophota bacterium]
MPLGRTGLTESVSLKNYTSIKIGGRAKYFYTAESINDLGKIVADIGSDFYLLGKGSNLLIADSLIEKPVVRLGKDFTYLKEKEDLLEVGASTPLSFLVEYCLENNLSGIENLVGIPATVGGLLAMNAASFGRSISSDLKEVDVMNREGEIKTYEKGEITLGYRFSSLQKYIILGARFRLSLKKNLRPKVDEFLGKRLSTQDFDFPSCGCIFKNTPEFSASFLIDSLRLKGMRKGDAQISQRHANFIINCGAAKYNDVDYLIQKIKDQIYKKYSIILQEEIKRWK